MKDTSRYILYAIIGIISGYIVYKIQSKLSAIKQLSKPEEKEEKREVLLVSFPIPKVVSQNDLQRLIDMAKPKRVLPSLKPLGVILEWDPIMLNTPIGKVGFTPPKKFLSLKDIQEVRNAINKSKVNIKDKGTYWEISFAIYI